MDTQIEAYDNSTEVAFWIAANMAAVVFIGFYLFFLFPVSANVPILDENKFIGLIFLVYETINILGGCFVIAFFQWIYIRRHLSKILGIYWLISGIVSSLLSFIVIIILVFALGDFPTEKEYLFVGILMISAQMIILSIVQGFVWLIKYSKKIKTAVTTAVTWGFINSLSFIIISFVSYHSIYSWSISLVLVYIMVTILMIIAFGLSGLLILRTLNTTK